MDAAVVYRRPDLLLVERSVARSAQEELLLRNISLVQHNKPELLERLARCMGVKVSSHMGVTWSHVGAYGMV